MAADGATKAIDGVHRWTPGTVIRGIQLSLGTLLAIEGLKMVGTWWLLGGAVVVAVLLLRNNRHAPTSIVLVPAEL